MTVQPVCDCVLQEMESLRYDQSLLQREQSALTQVASVWDVNKPPPRWTAWTWTCCFSFTETSNVRSDERSEGARSVGETSSDFSTSSVGVKASRTEHPHLWTKQGQGRCGAAGPLLPLHGSGPDLAGNQHHHQVQDVWPKSQMERWGTDSQQQHSQLFLRTDISHITMNLAFSRRHETGCLKRWNLSLRFFDEFWIFFHLSLMNLIWRLVPPLLQR